MSALETSSAENAPPSAPLLMSAPPRSAERRVQHAMHDEAWQGHTAARCTTAAMATIAPMRQTAARRSPECTPGAFGCSAATAWWRRDERQVRPYSQQDRPRSPGVGSHGSCVSGGVGAVTSAKCPAASSRAVPPLRAVAPRRMVEQIEVVGVGRHAPPARRRWHALDAVTATPSATGRQRHRASATKYSRPWQRRNNPRDDARAGVRVGVGAAGKQAGASPHRRPAPTRVAQREPRRREAERDSGQQHAHGDAQRQPFTDPATHSPVIGARQARRSSATRPARGRW